MKSDDSKRKRTRLLCHDDRAASSFCPYYLKDSLRKPKISSIRRDIRLLAQGQDTIIP